MAPHAAVVLWVSPEQLLRVRGTGWRRSRNVCEGVGEAAGLAAASAHLLGRAGHSRLQGPHAPPFALTEGGA